MNPRIAKDIQLVKWPVIAGIALMVGAGLMLPSAIMAVWMLACPIIAPAVFVNDFSPNGLPFAMTLPVRRAQLWREKMRVTVLALSLISMVYLLTYVAGPFEVVSPLVAVLLAVTLPVFCLGAGAVIALKVRQMIATFWLLLLAGGGLFVLCAMALPWMFPELNIFHVLNALFLVVGLVGVRVAARQFRQFEDDGPSKLMGHIDVAVASRGAMHQRGFAGKFGQLLVLARKEIVLQQLNVVLVVGVVLVMGITTLTTSMEYLIMVVWLPKVIALLVALVVGAVAFAEDERSGLASWALTFPVRRSQQFTVKILMASLTALVLSLGSLLAMDAIVGIRALPSQFTSVYELRGVHFVLLGIMAPIGACLVGAFTSSFSRSITSALSHSMVVGMMLLPVYAVFGEFLFKLVPADSRVVPYALLFITAAPALLCLFVWSSWRNFVRESTRSKAVGSYTALVVVLIGVMFVDALVYLRAWEWLEPNPTQSRFAVAPTKEFARDKPITSAAGSYVINRDGTLWRVHHVERTPRGGWVEHEPYQLGADNDWIDVVERGNGLFALKADGSLWMQGELMFRYLRFKPAGSGRYWYREGGRSMEEVLPDFQPVAPGIGWRSLQDGAQTAETIAIRDDGTLWMWGQSGSGILPVDLDGPVQMTQLSTDSDWKQVAGAFGLKQDGTLWALNVGALSSLGYGNFRWDWDPTEVPIGERFSELVPFNDQYWGTSVTGLTVDGNALSLGRMPTYAWPYGSPEVDGVVVRPIQETEEVTAWFANRQIVLSRDGVLLARNAQVDIGPAWVAMSPRGGFTRDGSYWHFRRDEWHATRGAHRIAEWLHLSLQDTTVDFLYPPRWRPKLAGALVGE